jgi:hypothetical protein
MGSMVVSMDFHFLDFNPAKMPFTYTDVILIFSELENQLLRSENKSFVEDHNKQISNIKRNKKEDSLTINSPGVNIFINSEFKNSTS